MPPVLNQTFANGAAANGAARPWSVEYQDQQQDDHWDEFVESLPDGHHEQTSLWGQVRAQNGWEVGRILVREDEKIMAGAQMMTRPLGRFGKLAYVTYGPCLKTHDPILENAMLAGLKQRAQLMGVRFLVVGLPYGGHGLAPGFVAAGFQRKPTRFPPHFLEATAVINLSLEPAQILANMHKSKRPSFLKRKHQSGGADRGGFARIPPTDAGPLRTAKHHAQSRPSGILHRTMAAFPTQRLDQTFFCHARVRTRFGRIGLPFWRLVSHLEGGLVRPARKSQAKRGS